MRPIKSFHRSDGAELPEFAGGLAESTKVYILESDKDGLHQIAQILQDDRNLSAVSIISRGSDGEIKLGSLRAAICLFMALTSQKAQTQGFVNAIAEATGSDVAAGDGCHDSVATEVDPIGWTGTGVI
jgi:Domain of unknown function (DUF4347)